MFRRIFDAFNFAGTEEPVPRRTVGGADRDDDTIDEDGWICFDMPTLSCYYDKDDFAFIDSPEIIEMGDDTMSLFGVGTAEEIKRREIHNLAKAKTALRNHLESVMFADPETGKDTRTVKSTRESAPHKAVVYNNVYSIRRLSFKSQRAKKSSGRSNDRKTHRVCALKLTEA